MFVESKDKSVSERGMVLKVARQHQQKKTDINTEKWLGPNLGKEKVQLIDPCDNCVQMKVKGG